MCSISPKCFPYCGMHGVGSRVLLPLPPLSSSSKRQARKASATQERPAFLCTSPCFWMRSKTYAFFAVCSWGPRSGCLGPHGGEGVRTGGRLHPGLVGERLLKQRPKVLRQADYDGLVNAGACGDDSDCVSEFIAAVPVELRRATGSPGTVTLNYGYMVQTRLLQVVGSPFGTLIESVDHDPSASFGHRPRGFLCSARVLAM